MTPGGDRLRTVACIVCLFYPTPTPPPCLHLIPHPAEDRVNSCLRSLHLAETEYCAVLHFSRRLACERLNFQPLFPHMIHYHQSLTEENKGGGRDLLHRSMQISISQRADTVGMSSSEILCANVFLRICVIISLCVSVLQSLHW